MINKNSPKTRLLIIVPTLNSYRDLPKLISSLQNQTFQEWRVIFVDGNSTRTHREYLKKICSDDEKFNWKVQKDHKSGIFGAMNEGFIQVKTNELLLFWGSDDWLPYSDSLSVALNKFDKVKNEYGHIDIFICKSRYFSLKDNLLTRHSYFIKKNKLISYFYFKLLLFIGRTPPHQTTFLSNSCREKINSFSEEYKLSADLNFFLKLSVFKDIKIYNFDHTLLYLSEGGVSGIKTFSRLKEVMKAYRNHFGLLSLITILLRYFFKIKTKFFKN